MAVNFEINIQSLNADISRIEGNLNFINNNLKAMFDEIAQLDAMWDGSANEAFNVQFKSDYEMMIQVCKNLKALLESMQNARDTYLKCESNVSSEISKIRV